MHGILAGLVAVATASSVQATTWTIAQNFSGSNFFSNWIYQNGIDANTTGNVLYQTQEQSVAMNLTYINAAGNAIIKVDNTTSGVNDPTYGRASVKLLSQATVPQGSLTIVDMVHMPFGCSVWPAYWMQGPNWPYDGEIDIVENVNLATNNQIALHTTQGCMHPATDASVGIETGLLQAPDCFNVTNGNEGCLVKDSSPNSFGAGFASQGGGAFAMKWDDTGIFIWFFNRSSIPSDVSTGSPNPDGWGLPTAAYPTSSCDTSTFFKPQTIIFDITLCGNFAGLPSVFNPTCSGNCTDLVPIPTNYNDAYFEIAYLHVFTNGTSTTGTSTASGTTASPSGSSGSGSAGSGSTSGSGAPHSATTTLFTAFLAVAVPVGLALGAMAL